MNLHCEPKSFPWAVLFWWVLANFIGVASEIVFLHLVDFAISMTGDYAKYIEPHLFPAPGFLVGLSLGLAVGFSQSLVIKKYLKNPFAWVFTTVAGFIIAKVSETVFFLFTFTLENSNINLSWILTGFFVGSFQWLVLRKQVQKSWMWIIVNIVIGIIMNRFFTFPWGDIEFLTFAIGSILTGITLAWLITSQKKVESIQ
ncbi:MAG: hypothetical protein HYZ25_09800 [Chloroflexi bacterium]|nr:hypothetical protein [Chloroflexota bacterium]